MKLTKQDWLDYAISLRYKYGFWIDEKNNEKGEQARKALDSNSPELDEFVYSAESDDEQCPLESITFPDFDPLGLYMIIPFVRSADIAPLGPISLRFLPPYDTSKVQTSFVEFQKDDWDYLCKNAESFKKMVAMDIPPSIKAYYEFESFVVEESSGYTAIRLAYVA